MNSSEEEVEDLRNRLEAKDKEIESNNKVIERLVKENESSLKYNNQLREEMKLLSAKLHLHQNVVKTTSSSVSIQTSDDDCRQLCNECKKSLNYDKTDELKDWKQKCANGKTKISDLVREVAEEVTQKNDFENDYVYDESTKTYYSRSTGWYYYPESLLFYDPTSKNYYKYDSINKRYNFHSTLKEMDRKRSNFSKNSKTKKKKIEVKNGDKSKDGNIDTIDVSSEEEEGEIDDSDDASVISDDTNESDFEIEEVKTKSSPPMIRMIVKESTTLDIGSLLLVTCMGAKVGNDSNCQLYITDESVSRSHADIRYDYERSNYVIKDLNSTNGTFANGVRVKANCETDVKHCDELSFGKCVLLVHIHNGQDVTCDRCEPGLVMASLKSSPTTHNSGFYSQTDREKDRKKQLKSLKKKYGLKDADFIEPKANTSANSKYKDRATKRRVEKGSDNPYEKTAAGTSLDSALSESNKGFQLLSKMGWTAGQALGKHQNGIVEPINAINPDLHSQTSAQTES